MADARLLHKRGSHGVRVIALDHLAFRVWVQYVLSADDYGVMRGSASVIRSDNPKLEDEPLRRIEGAMRQVLDSRLIQTFTHQGVTYWWQADWQDFQGIEYPRDTAMPAPPADALMTATMATRRLFWVHHLPSKERVANLRRTTLEEFAERFGEQSASVRRDISEDSASLRRPPYAHARETHTQTQAQRETPEESGRETNLPGHHGPMAATGAGLRPGGLIGDHRRCDPIAAEGCARGKCVPARLVGEWRAQFGDDRESAEREIRAVIRDTLAATPPGPIGDDGFTFWGRAWSQRHSSAAGSPSARRVIPLADELLDAAMLAGMNKRNAVMFLAGAELERRDGDVVALVISDDGDRAFVQKHWGDGLDSVFTSRGATKFLITDRRSA